jgi:hypothetical protein
MRLFEVDHGSARDALAVIQGLANKEGQPSELPFPTIMNILRPFGLGISSPDGLIALKNKVDPAGDVIQDILDDGTVILNTTIPSNVTPDAASDTSSSPSVDQMASRNTDLSPRF